MTKSEVLARLSERHARFSSSAESLSASSRSAIQRTLNALGSTHSHYVVLSSSERERARSEWKALADLLGITFTPKKPRQAKELPTKVLDFFGTADCLPHRPRATDDYDQGSQRVSWTIAQDMRSVDLNPPSHVHWLVFDCDHTEADRWRTAGLPEPSFITLNPVNGHHHVVYRLSAPVCRSERAHAHPKDYLYAVQMALCLALGGDLSYAGTLTKNPVHSAWVTIRSNQMPLYSLGQLSATLDITTGYGGESKRNPRESSVGANLSEIGVGGRNRALFDAVRSRPKSALNILGYAQHCNAMFPEPLDPQEVKGIANSIERYEAKRKSPRNAEKFRATQAVRGRLGGRPQTTKKSQPWTTEGVSRATWYRSRKALLPVSEQKTKGHSLGNGNIGRPITTKDSCPWIAAGVSRATWYRRFNAGSCVGKEA